MGFGAKKLGSPGFLGQGSFLIALLAFLHEKMAILCSSTAWRALKPIAKSRGLVLPRANQAKLAGKPMVFPFAHESGISHLAMFDDAGGYDIILGMPLG